MRIVKYSHHFSVTPSTGEQHRVMMAYVSKLAQYQPKYIRGRYVSELVKVWAVSVLDKSVVRLHISQYHTFIMHMGHSGFKESDFKVMVKRLYEPATTAFTMFDGFKAHDYQEDYITYLNADGSTKVLTLQTGHGKTFVSLAAIADMKVRTVLIVPAKYIKKWVGDVEGAYGKSADITVIQGSKDLRTLLELAKDDNLKTDFIIISSTTMFNYFKDYAKTDCFSYDVKPYDFYRKLKVGVRLIDECHENLHLNYSVDLYAHVPKSISLSATLESDNPFINNIFALMFPMAVRPKTMAYNKYTNVHALHYRTTAPERIRCTLAKMYNHTTYEDYIMKCPKRLKNYVDMILDINALTYMETRKEKQKCLIFAATVAMCNVIKEALVKRYPNEKITTKVSGDDHSVLEAFDIIVSTLLSTGTAVDIYGLITVIMTTALASRQANLQAIGRLRELKAWPGQTPDFYYLVCLDIPKHLEYAERKKKDVFAGKALTYRDKYTKYVV